MIGPSSPPPVHVCGGELYCTITLTEFDGFESSGRRSGEIFELSANAAPAAIRAIPKMAHRISRLCIPVFRQLRCQNLICLKSSSSVPSKARARQIVPTQPDNVSRYNGSG